MKLYNGLSPNGRRVEIYLAEKGIKIPTINIDVMAGDAQKPDFLAINSLGEVPVLALDDGTIITESLAICRYLEALHPSPSLMGENAKEQAVIEMWARRIEQQFFLIVGTIGLHEIPYFEHRVEQMPDYAATQRRAIVKKFAWLDQEISDGRPFIAGQAFSIADITGMAAIMICGFMKIDIPEEYIQLSKWVNTLKNRPSFKSISTS